MAFLKKKKTILVLAIFGVLALVTFLTEQFSKTDNEIFRNDYGKGSKTEEYELTVDGEIKEEAFQFEVKERQYTKEEVKELFEKASEELDQVVLGDNESFDHVDKNLKLVTTLPNYPLQIRWELDSYGIMNIEGELLEENLSEKGTLLGIKGILSYGEESTEYIRFAMVYPVVRTGTDKLRYDIQKAISDLEAGTRAEESFTLPEELDGKKLNWGKKTESRWLYVLLLGPILVMFLTYREYEEARKEKQRRKERLMREYPAMISRLTMLIGTNGTVKSAWEKIVENYENQKEEMGEEPVYEEMKTTLCEMQGGISETEAYERFGNRCGITAYMKFGAMLSQNLRKGGRGISELLKIEAIQAFETRKSTAKRKGEEAGTKLMMPMLGMLAVVLMMVIVPAFLTMQI